MEFREMSIDELKDFIKQKSEEFDEVVKQMESDDAPDDAPNDAPDDSAESNSDDTENKEEKAKSILAEKREAMEMLKNKEHEAEKRKRLEEVRNGEIDINLKERKEDKVNEREERAKVFAETGKMEIRQLLATGKIATPTAVGGIEDIAPSEAGIVDDVHAVSLVGNGVYRVAYKSAEAIAAAVTDGSTIGGTASTYNYVDISPSEWGVLDEISKMVTKMTPLDYQSAIAGSAVRALRSYACTQIVTKLAASTLLESVTVPLDQDYLRTLVLGFHAIPGKGETRLYIGQDDMATLGKIRGTNEKKPLYDISFDAGTTTSGTITEGGLAVKFRILPDLASGTQYFGQPGTIDMPMWGDYEVETDEGGDYFKRNMIGIRGLQLAGADLVAYHGMQVVANASA